jgi:hypothetical protein
MDIRKYLKVPHHYPRDHIWRLMNYRCRIWSRSTFGAGLHLEQVYIWSSHVRYFFVSDMLRTYPQA